MEEPFLPAVVANEPEPSIPNESLDRPCRHPNVSLGAHMPEEMAFSNLVPVTCWGDRAEFQRVAASSSAHRDRKTYPAV
jgi:hypothetical protein